MRLKDFRLQSSETLTQLYAFLPTGHRHTENAYKSLVPCFLCLYTEKCHLSRERVKSYIIINSLVYVK